LPSWLELRSTLLLALGSRIPPLQPGALVAAVAQQLASRAQRLGVAESCTGGLLAHWLTQIPGSSAWFVGGVVAYSNALKVALLGVKHQTLDEFGAVSPETVSEMAAGALALPDCTLAVATSGVAGPTGGSPKKPVGTVEFALARANSPVAHTRAHFAGSRTEVQARAATFALHWVYALLFDPARTG
jgi:nicotinamide-nucleotide amidase